VQTACGEGRPHQSSYLSSYLFFYLAKEKQETYQSLEDDYPFVQYAFTHYRGQGQGMHGALLTAFHARGNAECIGMLTSVYG
jgi:hypothetical protein